MNQSKLVVITFSWRKARENACERVTTGFGRFYFWLDKKNGESYLTQSFSVVDAKSITFYTQMKKRSNFTDQNAQFIKTKKE